MGRRGSLWLVLLVLCVAGPSSAQRTETLQGYAEWRKGYTLIIDGQRVVTDARTSFKGKGVKWVYPGLAVVFVKGKVTDVKF